MDDSLSQEKAAAIIRALVTTVKQFCSQPEEGAAVLGAALENYTLEMYGDQKGFLFLINAFETQCFHYREELMAMGN